MKSAIIYLSLFFLPALSFAQGNHGDRGGGDIVGRQFVDIEEEAVTRMFQWQQDSSLTLPSADFEQLKTCHSSYLIFARENQGDEPFQEARKTREKEATLYIDRSRWPETLREPKAIQEVIAIRELFKVCGVSNEIYELRYQLRREEETRWKQFPIDLEMKLVSATASAKKVPNLDLPLFLTGLLVASKLDTDYLNCTQLKKKAAFSACQTFLNKMEPKYRDTVQKWTELKQESYDGIIRDALEWRADQCDQRVRDLAKDTIERFDNQVKVLLDSARSAVTADSYQTKCPDAMEAPKKVACFLEQIVNAASAMQNVSGKLDAELSELLKASAKE